jgi:uncharacterized membrane protein
MQSNYDPSKYKWGIFYYNKEDKRIFPPRSSYGIGWTANPLSILALIALIILIVALSNFLSHLK